MSREIPFATRGCAWAAIATVVSLTALVDSVGRAAVVKRADYETGDFSQWVEVQPAWRIGRATIVKSPVRAGRYAARFEVRPGDSIPSGGELNQVYWNQAGTRGTEGEELYYAWSTYIPSGQQWTSYLDWNVITEWHHSSPTCPPPLQLGVYPSRPPRLYVDTTVIPNARSGNCAISRRNKWYMPLATNRWMDFVFHVKWSADSRVGFVEVWQDRVLRIPKTYVATLHKGLGVYLKQGFYRAAASFTNVVFNDEMRIATRLEDVGIPAVTAKAGLAKHRTRIERSGRSWERFLRTHPRLARAGGIKGVKWAGEVFYTKPYFAQRLEARSTSFREWASRHRRLAASLDWAATETPYVAIVGSPRLDRGRLSVQIRSALARSVSIAIRDRAGRLVGTSRSQMPERGAPTERVLTERIALRPARDRTVVLTVRSVRGVRTWTLKRSFTLP